MGPKVFNLFRPVFIIINKYDLRSETEARHQIIFHDEDTDFKPWRGGGGGFFFKMGGGKDVVGWGGGGGGGSFIFRIWGWQGLSGVAKFVAYSEREVKIIL